jgi:cation transporter-like permease
MKKEKTEKRLAVESSGLERAFDEAHAHKRVVVTPRLPRKLEALRALPRKHFHALQHELHKKHKLSRKTLFYVKEYGPHSNVAGTIIKESVKILLLASLISSLGGLALEEVKPLLVSLVPIVVLLPALNHLIGNCGTIFSSKFSAMLWEGKMRGLKGPALSEFNNAVLRKLFAQVLVLAVFSALAGAAAALMLSGQRFSSDAVFAAKIFAISLIDSVILVFVLLAVAVLGGTYFYAKREDPNNFLIPITTSVADFGNMLLLALLVTLFF